MTRGCATLWANGHCTLVSVRAEVSTIASRASNESCVPLSTPDPEDCFHRTSQQRVRPDASHVFGHASLCRQGTSGRVIGSALSGDQCASRRLIVPARERRPSL
jgi:hypothetical protein